MVVNFPAVCGVRVNSVVSPWVMSESIPSAFMRKPCVTSSLLSFRSEVIADGGELPGGLRREGQFGGFALGDVRIDPERLHEETVRHVFAPQLELHGFTLSQRDLVRAEFKPLGCDRHYTRGFGAGSAEPRRQSAHR